MKKRFSFSAMAVAVALAFSFTACGDDSSSGSSDNTISSKEDMEKESCSADNKDEIIHVEDEDADYRCDGENWVKLVEEGDDVSSSSKAKSSADDENLDEESSDSGEEELSSDSDETSSDSEEASSSSNAQSNSSTAKSSSSEEEVVGVSSSSEEEVVGESSSSEEEVVGASSSSAAGYKIVVMAGSSSSQRTMIYMGETMLFTVPGLAACNYEVDDDTYLYGDNIGDTGYDDDCPMNLENGYDGTESVKLTFSVTGAEKIIVPNEEYKTLADEELPASVQVTLCGTTYCRPSAFAFLDGAVSWKSNTEATITVSESQLETVAKALQAALEREGYERSSTDVTLFTKEETKLSTAKIQIGNPLKRGEKVLIPLSCTIKSNKIKL